MPFTVKKYTIDILAFVPLYRLAQPTVHRQFHVQLQNTCSLHTLVQLVLFSLDSPSVDTCLQHTKCRRHRQLGKWHFCGHRQPWYLEQHGAPMYSLKVIDHHPPSKLPTSSSANPTIGFTSSTQFVKPFLATMENSGRWSRTSPTSRDSFSRVGLKSRHKTRPWSLV